MIPGACADQQNSIRAYSLTSLANLAEEVVLLAGKFPMPVIEQNKIISRGRKLRESNQISAFPL
jgi:hypothetical protein